MTEGYRRWHLPVGPTERIPFVGREVAKTPGGRGPALFETPEGELKIHVTEQYATRGTEVRPLGEEATETGVTGGGLFSVTEAEQKYPGLLRRLLEKKQAGEELGR